MVRKTIKPVQDLIEGQFFDIVIPELEWIKLKLTHVKTNWTHTKTNVIEKVEDNFSVTIDVSENISNEDKDLSLKIQEISKLTFPPYYWRDKQYRFYTTERTGSIEDKKEMLNGLIDLLKAYELEKKSQIDESNALFKEDLRNNLKLETVDLLMKVHQPTQRFVVLAKGFLGGDHFALLKKSSEYSSKLYRPEEISPTNINKYILSTDFFADDIPAKKLEKKSYFFINPSNYENIKHHFNFAEKEQKQFIEQQKQVSLEHDLSQYNIETDNVFGLKIKFVEDHQCFEFYGKGYFDNIDYHGNVSPRSLLGIWALNFIYSEDRKESLGYCGRDFYIERDKIILEEVKGGTKKEKNIRIPASEWPKIKKIKENFEEENKFWAREEKSLKITHCDISGLGVFEQFPAVYFDSRGDAFLAFGSRRTGIFRAIGENTITPDIFDPPSVIIEGAEGKVKKPRQNKFSITLKTIPISFEEAKYFMNEHPFADHINKGTFELNAKVHGPTDVYIMSYDEKKEVFETVYLHAELHNQTKKEDKPKSKRIKI